MKDNINSSDQASAVNEEEMEEGLIDMKDERSNEEEDWEMMED